MYNLYMLPFLKHLFTPTQANNNRAKLLHHKSLFTLIVLVLSMTFFVSSFQKSQPEVLGIRYSISETRLLSLTNQIRSQNQLNELRMDSRLSKAAEEKLSDMFEKNYWAHFAPDGSTTPWYFIKKEGYEYTYAGENLAKGFTDSDEIVSAWMNSPSHKENMLSDKYQDVGFAVGEGDLTGEKTTLVVEMFGSTNEKINVSESSNSQKVTVAKVSNSGVVMSEVIKNPKIDVLFTTKSISLFVLLIILMALVVDLFVIRKKNIQRVVGHNLDHIMLVGGIIILAFVLLSQGVIK